MALSWAFVMVNSQAFNDPSEMGLQGHSFFGFLSCGIFTDFHGLLFV